MRFKKPYSQYTGKAILYDYAHKHFITQVLGTEGDWIYFNTVCVSTRFDTKVEISDSAGFMINSSEVELSEIGQKEKHLIIKAAIQGIRRP